MEYKLTEWLMLINHDSHISKLDVSNSYRGKRFFHPHHRATAMRQLELGT